jgi:hypothetical protein
MTNEELKEEIKEEGESLDFNSPAFTFTPAGRHTYRQEGYYLVCKSCELHHAVFIGPDKIMVGETEDGKPILKNKKELGYL